MTAVEIASAVNGTVLTEPMSDAVATSGYSSDLLSDVIGNACNGAVLITVQNHINTIAVCTLVGIRVIVVCHSRPIPEEMICVANREKVAVISTPFSQFACSVALSDLPPCARS